MNRGDKATLSAARLKKQLIELRKRGMDNPQVSDLDAVRTVAAALVPDAALECDPKDGGRYWAENQDQDVRRIEVLLECAIDGYNDPDDYFNDPRMVEVVRLWFGLHPTSRKLDHEQRHEIAARTLKKKTGNFKAHYAGKIKDALGLRLMPRFEKPRPFTMDEAVNSVPGSAGQMEVETVKKAGPQTTETSEPSPRWHFGVKSLRQRKTFLFATLLSLAAAVVAAAMLGAFSSHEDREVIPPPGSVINATTGEIDAEPDLRGPMIGSMLSGGGLFFRACDLNQEPECTVHGGTFSVHRGDMMAFVYVLYHPGKGQIPYIRLDSGLSTRGLKKNELRVTSHFGVPGNDASGVPPSSFEGNPVKLIADFQPASLRFVPGSTELTRANTQSIGRLPDGIMGENGISLTHVGHPVSCFFRCAPRYTRFVIFKARVIQAAYPRP